MTPKQERFCNEYLIDLNATQAAIRAGYSAKTAYSIGQDNLKKPEIQNHLSNRMKDREKRTEISQDRVLQEYAKLAFLDPRRFYDDSGRLIPVNELEAEVAAALVSFEVQSIGGEEIKEITKIKVSDKKGALDSVARHLGMFVDRSVVDMNLSLENMTEDELNREILKNMALVELPKASDYQS